MSHITINTNTLKIEVDLTPSADFVTCLIPALLAAIPAFLQSFMSCLAGGATTPGFNPGNRPRCQ